VPAAVTARENSVRQHRGIFPRVLGIIALAIFVAIAALYFLVAREAKRDEIRPADVIIVFGAAEYAGHPSPAYRARLDHALELYQHGLAPMIITSGGAGGDPRYNEGEVGRDYLVARGVPEARLIAETQGEDTLESTARLAAIMRENGMKNCLAVSDGYHMFRIKRMMQRQGIATYAAPRPDPHAERLATLVEVFKFLAWKSHLER
jgi:uncharacterized SAM-binding protein YcdF (DUF218 family)